MNRIVLTPSEVAERWGLKAETIRLKVEAGEIPAFDVSSPSAKRRRWRIAIEVIEAIERGEKPRAPAPPPTATHAKRRRQSRGRRVDFCGPF